MIIRLYVYSCTSCASTQVSFSCLWCVSSFTCINKNEQSSCDSGTVESDDVIIGSDGASQGVEFCPKFTQVRDAANPMLIPSGTSPDIEFIVSNVDQIRVRLRNYTTFLLIDSHYKIITLLSTNQ